MCKSCDYWQSYYGNAIRAHKVDLVGMRKAIWAVYFHKSSSDQNSTHNFCDISWCPFLKAEQAGKDYTHGANNYLPSAVMQAISPVWKDLSKTELLVKCLSGYSQNQNESLNSIWKYCPERKHHGLETVETAVGVAVSIFNDGCSSLMAILRKMDISPKMFCRRYCEEAGVEHIKNAQRQAHLASKQICQARRRR